MNYPANAPLATPVRRAWPVGGGEGAGGEATKTPRRARDTKGAGAGLCEQPTQACAIEGAFPESVMPGPKAKGIHRFS